MADKFIPYDKASKQEQHERDQRKRGFPVPPSQIHKSDVEYDRKKNNETIDDELETLGEDDV
jgi:hypothetical protein